MNNLFSADSHSGCWLLALLFLLLSGCSPPSDNSLIRRFNRSHDDFEHLRQMIDQDNLQGRIHAGYADPHLPDARLAEYRKLMKDINVMRLWAHGTSQPFELIVDANGWLDAGDYKGYWYEKSTPHRSSASLNEGCFALADAEKDETHCSAFRELGNGWWLLRYEYR